MTKADLVERVTAQISRTAGPMISKKDCARVVDAFLDAIKEALQEQKNIEVRGFGTFKIRHRKTRMARNPRTGSPVEVSARPVPVFKPSRSCARWSLVPSTPKSSRTRTTRTTSIIAKPGALRRAFCFVGAASNGTVVYSRRLRTRYILRISMTVTVLALRLLRRRARKSSMRARRWRPGRRCATCSSALAHCPAAIACRRGRSWRSMRSTRASSTELRGGDEVAVIPPVAGG